MCVYQCMDGWVYDLIDLMGQGNACTKMMVTNFGTDWCEVFC